MAVNSITVVIVGFLLPYLKLSMRSRILAARRSRAWD